MLSEPNFLVAKKIVQKLNEQGFKAYFAGGWVRDWLLGHPSSDIDIATDAPLPNIIALFSSVVLIGIDFGVVSVQLEGHSFEVAIFRRDLGYTNGRKPDQIEPSTPEEDASRRDFTINGMFYDPIEEKIYDFVGGREDLKKGIIKTIGDPFERFEEDRLRMIRAVRFAHRFSFHIDPLTEEAIKKCAPFLFPAVAKERIYQELSKMNESPSFDQGLIDLFRLGLLEEIFPSLAKTHLNHLKDRLHKMADHLPLVAKLQEILSENGYDELLSIKISNKEKELVLFLQKVKKILLSGGFSSDAEWAKFYAHPSAQIAIDLYSHSTEQLERQQKLSVWVERIKNKDPLITSDKLLKLGILPGPRMGYLLKKGEELAINQNLSDAEEVIKRLKNEGL